MKTVQELELDRGELLIAKQKLIAEKSALVGQLVEINSACKVRLPNSTFQKLQSRRGRLAKQLLEKECEISSVKAQINEIQTVIDVQKIQTFSGTHVRQLVVLRDKWHDFSMDASNHQKSREAAWKFSQELRQILKTFFSVS